MDPMVVIDASVWVGWFILQDAHHQASRTWIMRYISAGGVLVTPELLWVEVAAAVSRRTGLSALGHQAVQQLAQMPLLRFVPLDSALIRNAATIASDQQLRAGDAIYVAVAQQLAIPLLTWDTEQLQRASPLVRAYTPASYAF